MLWTDKIEIIISVSILLIILPCLAAYSFKQPLQNLPVEMGLLLSGMDVLAAEIIILLLLALYFSCRQYKMRTPTAVAAARSIRGTYLAADANVGHLNVDFRGRNISQQNQSVAWEISSKEKVIFD